VEVLIGLSLLLAGIVGGVGLIVFYRRRQAERARLRSDELRALDQRIATRIAGLREGGNAAVPPPPRSDDELADLARPIPALLPLESGTSLRSRLGLRRPSRDVDPAERSTSLRDTAVVLGVGVVLLVIASQFLPASTPPPNSTATPTSSLVAQLPTGTPNLLNPTPVSTATPAETPLPTPDITFEPTPTPIPTAAPSPVPGGGGGGGGGGGPTPTATPNPTVKPDTTPPSKPALFGIQSLSPTSVTLNWAASTDNVGVTGYRIYRNNLLRTTVTALSYTDSTLTPGTSYTYAARAVDAAGNLSIAAIQAVTAPSATPTPCVAVSITISPASATVTAGSGQSYSATDNCGNTVAATYSMSTDGACSGSTCTPTTAGSQTVTGSSSGHTDTATLNVNAGALASISISPPTATIAATTSQTYTATGFDAYGNSLGDVTSATTFSILPNADLSACSSNSCTPQTPASSYTVTGDAGGGITDSATLNTDP
jgi:hypothetical protein